MSLAAEAAYLFRHVMLRDAAYALQLPADRASLHALALKALEEVHPDAHRDAVAAELANHARNAGLAAAELAYLRRAVKCAAREYRTGDAAELGLRCARHSLAPTQERALFLNDAAARAMLLGRLDQARDWLVEARRLTGDQALLGDIQGNLVTVCADTADFEAGRIELARLRELAAVEPSIRARAHAVCGRFFDATSDLDEAEREYRQAITLAEESGRHDAAATSRINLGGMLGERGRHDQAQEMLEQARQTLEKSGNLRPLCTCLGNLGWVATQRQKNTEAEGWLRQAAELARRIGSRYDLGTVLGNLGNALDGLKRYTEAEAVLLEALEIHSEVGNTRHVGIVLSDLAFVEMNLGRYEQAEARAAQAVKISARLSNQRTVAIAQSVRGRALMDLGRMPEAYAVLKEGLATAREFGSAFWISPLAYHLAQACVALGRLDEARPLATEALITARTLNMPNRIAEAEALLAAIG